MSRTAMASALTVVRNVLVVAALAVLAYATIATPSSAFGRQGSSAYERPATPALATAR